MAAFLIIENNSKAKQNFSTLIHINVFAQRERDFKVSRFATRKCTYLEREMCRGIC